MIYLDTSLIVAAITPEVGTEAAQALLQSTAGGHLCVSDWVMTEVSGALAFKVRTKQIDAAQRIRALQSWRALLDTSFNRLSIDRQVFDQAASYFERSDINVRSSDALHIAIADLNGCSLATLDRLMATAARQLGVEVVEVD
ncbi:MAG: type II toxin-antitoxin system VapC family toxin [Sphingopyxis sp.]